MKTQEEEEEEGKDQKHKQFRFLSLKYPLRFDRFDSHSGT